MGKKRASRAITKGEWVESSAPLNNPFAKLGGRPGTPTEPPTPVPEPPNAVPPPRRAVVRLERKGRGGKRVTVVSHLALGPDRLETWCRDLRRSLGCGGQVEADLIVLHGDQRDRLLKILSDRGVAKITRS